MEKVILTGAAGGIGRAVLKKLCEQGASVYVTASSQEKLDKLQAEFSQVVGCYIGDISKQEGLIDDAVEKLGRVDALIHCAGMTKDGLAIRMSDEQWQDVIDVNLTGAFKLSRDVIRHMARNNYGRIVYVTSVVGQAGNIGQANYISSKAGLTGLAKALACEYGGKNITVNCVEPGFIETPMTADLPEKIKEMILSKVPLKRMGTPEEVAACILFLASKASSYVTGSVLRVNGGMYML